MESKEEKLERLRAERELQLKEKYKNQEFYINDTGGLSRYGWGDNIFYVGMIVKVIKPDNTWRKGEIEYINLENNYPKIGVICGKNKIKFEKTWGQVVADDRIEQIVSWENVEVPERLKKMSTIRLLSEFKKVKKSYHRAYYKPGEDILLVYKKELYLREHIGHINASVRKKIRQKRAKEKNGKRD